MKPTSPHRWLLLTELNTIWLPSIKWMLKHLHIDQMNIFNHTLEYLVKLSIFTSYKLLYRWLTILYEQFNLDDHTVWAVQPGWLLFPEQSGLYVYPTKTCINHVPVCVIVMAKCPLISQAISIVVLLVLFICMHAWGMVIHYRLFIVSPSMVIWITLCGLLFSRQWPLQASPSQFTTWYVQW